MAMWKLVWLLLLGLVCWPSCRANHITSLGTYRAPVICVQPSQYVTFLGLTKDHYPVFDASNALTTNTNFDDTAYNTTLTALLAQAGNSTFDLTFQFERQADYVFHDSEIKDLFTVVTVRDADSACPGAGGGGGYVSVTNASRAAVNSTAELPQAWRAAHQAEYVFIFIAIICAFGLVAGFAHYDQVPEVVAYEDDLELLEDNKDVFRRLFKGLAEQQTEHKAMLTELHEGYVEHSGRLDAEMDQLKALLSTELEEGQGYVEAATNLLLSEVTCSTTYTKRQRRLEEKFMEAFAVLVEAVDYSCAKLQVSDRVMHDNMIMDKNESVMELRNIQNAEATGIAELLTVPGSESKGMRPKSTEMLAGGLIKGSRFDLYHLQAAAENVVELIDKISRSSHKERARREQARKKAPIIGDQIMQVLTENEINEAEAERKFMGEMEQIMKLVDLFVMQLQIAKNEVDSTPGSGSSSNKVRRMRTRSGSRIGSGFRGGRSGGGRNMSTRMLTRRLSSAARGGSRRMMSKRQLTLARMRTGLGVSRRNLTRTFAQASEQRAMVIISACRQLQPSLATLYGPVVETHSALEKERHSFVDNSEKAITLMEENAERILLKMDEGIFDNLDPDLVEALKFFLGRVTGKIERPQLVSANELGDDEVVEEDRKEEAEGEGSDPGTPKLEPVDLTPGDSDTESKGDKSGEESDGTGSTGGDDAKDGGEDNATEEKADDDMHLDGGFTLKGLLDAVYEGRSATGRELALQRYHTARLAELADEERQHLTNLETSLEDTLKHLRVRLEQKYNRLRQEVKSGDDDVESAMVRLEQDFQAEMEQEGQRLRDEHARLVEEQKEIESKRRGDEQQQQDLEMRELKRQQTRKRERQQLHRVFLGGRNRAHGKLVVEGVCKPRFKEEIEDARAKHDDDDVVRALKEQHSTEVRELFLEFFPDEDFSGEQWTMDEVDLDDLKTKREAMKERLREKLAAAKKSLQEQDTEFRAKLKEEREAAVQQRMDREMRIAQIMEEEFKRQQAEEKRKLRIKMERQKAMREAELASLSEAEREAEMRRYQNQLEDQKRSLSDQLALQRKELDAKIQRQLDSAREDESAAYDRRMRIKMKEHDAKIAAEQERLAKEESARAEALNERFGNILRVFAEQGSKVGRRRRRGVRLAIQRMWALFRKKGAGLVAAVAGGDMDDGAMAAAGMHLQKGDMRLVSRFEGMEFVLRKLLRSKTEKDTGGDGSEPQKSFRENFRDALESKVARTGNRVEPVSLLKCHPRDFLVRQFMQYMCDVITASLGLPRVSVRIASKLPTPPSGDPSYTDDLFLNSYEWDDARRILWVHMSRLSKSSLGRLGLFVVYAMSRHLSGLYANDHPRFLQAFTKSVAALCSEYMLACSTDHNSTRKSGVLQRGLTATYMVDPSARMSSLDVPSELPVEPNDCFAVLVGVREFFLPKTQQAAFNKGGRGTASTASISPAPSSFGMGGSDVASGWEVELPHSSDDMLEFVVKVRDIGGLGSVVGRSFDTIRSTKNPVGNKPRVRRARTASSAIALAPSVKELTMPRLSFMGSALEFAQASEFGSVAPREAVVADEAKADENVVSGDDGLSRAQLWVKLAEVPGFQSNTALHELLAEDSKSDESSSSPGSGNDGADLSFKNLRHRFRVLLSHPSLQYSPEQFGMLVKAQVTELEEQVDSLHAQLCWVFSRMSSLTGNIDDHSRAFQKWWRINLVSSPSEMEGHRQLWQRNASQGDPLCLQLLYVGQLVEELRRMRTQQETLHWQISRAEEEHRKCVTILRACARMHAGR